MRQFLTIILTLVTMQIFAQYAPITFDESMKSFNNFEPLPSEKDLMITGATTSDISVIEFSFYKAKDDDFKSPLYIGSWERGEGDRTNAYKLPVNYKLSASKKYSIRVKSFQKIGQKEKVQVFQALTNNLDAYLGQVLQSNEKKLSLTKKTKYVMSDLNKIVTQGLKEYRISNGLPFNGFSDLVKGQLNAIDDKKFGKVLFDRGATSQNAATIKYRDQLINDLQTLVHSEVRFLLNSDVSKLVKQIDAQDLKTDSKGGYFALNIGYGAVYIDGEIDNLEYGTAPYVGLGFPLSTSTIAPKFLRNASVTLGVFLKNFEDVGERTTAITGPIVKRPVYLGLDYKLFQFIRFNAGVTALEEENEDTGNITGIEKRVFFRPFVGLSAKINLSIGLDK